MLFVFSMAAVMLLVPSTALAFGPVAHVDMGLQVVQQAGAVSAALGTLLGTYRREFLLGILGPDRVVAKNLAPYAWHSHNWNRAFIRLFESGDDRERATLYGWLCHLAADVVAHNYFVPAKVAQSYGHGLAGHVYWEMRLDARLHGCLEPRTIRRLAPSSVEHRRFLAKVMPPMPLGPRINFGLTSFSIKVQDGPAYRKFGRFMDTVSRLPLSRAETERVCAMAVEAQLSVLERLDDAPITRLDPRGIASIRAGRAVRGRLESMTRHGRGATPDVARIARDAERTFREGVESSLAA